MYGYVSDENVVKALALLGVLAMVGMAVMPLAVGDAAYLIDQWINNQPNNDKIPQGLKTLASGTGAFTAGNLASICVRLALIYAGYGAAAGPVGVVAGFAVGLA